jgi:DNA-binding beta-propeller fold protein YncE
VKTRSLRRGLRWLLPCAALLGALVLLVAQVSTAIAARRHQMHRHRRSSSAQTRLDALVNREVGSTVPANGDTNPYGVAVVPFSSGKLVKGDVLVANFNNSNGTAGAGTTVVQIDPATGSQQLFYQGQHTVVGPVGIAINPTKDIVWLGDFGPANSSGVWDGAHANVDVISPAGKLLATYDNQTTQSGIFNGVWGMAFSDIDGHVSFYWPNAGDGTTGAWGGTVWQLHPLAGVNGQPLQSSYTLLGGGFAYQNMPGTTAATAAGPEGVAWDADNHTLYVTDDMSNEIVAIRGLSGDGAGTYMSRVVASGGMLDAPQGIAVDPADGDLLVVNGAGNNDLLEFTPEGRLVAHRDLLPGEAPGALFGLAATRHGDRLTIYYGDDDTNTLWSLSGSAGPMRRQMRRHDHHRSGPMHGKGRHSRHPGLMY